MDLLGDIKKIREKRPLIHHIMNFVVMNDAANVTLAVGASPIMAHAEEELEDLVNVADVIYINIGTLDRYFINSMKRLASLAVKYSKPLLLDPVGAGATQLRTNVTREILATGGVSVLKGNSGEMLSLAGIANKVKGVDSLAESGEEAAEILARNYGITAIATGKIDFASDGRRTYSVEGGSEIFKFVTGTGCMLGSVISAFMGVNKDFLIAGVEGLLVFKRAGEIAETRAGNNPGKFKVELIDALFNIEKLGIDLNKVKQVK